MRTGDLDHIVELELHPADSRRIRKIQNEPKRAGIFINTSSLAWLHGSWTYFNEGASEA